MTSSRRSWQKSMSKSGIETRSGLRKRSNSRPKRKRIEIGDRQRIGDERTGARAAPRPDRNALRLRIFDEIRDDQEIAGKLHLHDDVELEGEALAIIVVGQARRRAHAPRAARRAPPPPGGSVPPLSSVAAAGRCRNAAGSACASTADRRSAKRSRRVFSSASGRSAKSAQHLRARLETMLGRQAAAARIADHRALGDAEQRIMRLVIGCGAENRPRWSRQAAAECAIAEIEKLRLDRTFLAEPMPLQFEIEPIGKELVAARQAGARQARAGRARSCGRAGHRDRRRARSARRSGRRAAPKPHAADRPAQDRARRARPRCIRLR